MSPIFSSGANTAERVPTTTRASPFRTRHHSRARSTSLSAECKTATPSNRAPASPAPRANTLRFSRCRSHRRATAHRTRQVQTARASLSARSLAPHSIHARAVYTPHQMDPPPDQSAPPNFPATRRATSVQRKLASPAPASEVAAEAAAHAPSPAIPARALLCASSARSASLRYLFPLSFPLLFLPSIFQPRHLRPSKRSRAASFGFFPARFPEFQ